MMKRLADRHVGKQGLPPFWIFVLSETKTGSSEDELVIVIVEAKRVEIVNSVIYQTEVHACYCKALGGMSLSLILS